MTIGDDSVALEEVTSFAEEWFALVLFVSGVLERVAAAAAGYRESIIALASCSFVTSKCTTLPSTHCGHLTQREHGIKSPNTLSDTSTPLAAGHTGESEIVGSTENVGDTGDADGETPDSEATDDLRAAAPTRLLVAVPPPVADD